MVPKVSASCTGEPTEAKDFWLGWPDVEGTTARLFITSRYTANVQISGAGTWMGIVTRGYPGLYDLPGSAKVVTDRVVENKGIHVTSNQPVNVMLLSPLPSESVDDAFLALPANVLGTEYYTVSYPPHSTDYESEFLIIGTEDNTTLYWVDACGESTGVITVLLDQGQTYQHKCANDITGSYIRSDKPIAVIGASTGSFVPEPYGYLDSLLTFILPTKHWGTEYFTTPMYQTNPTPVGDIVRIMAANAGTEVIVDDGISPSLHTIESGEFVELDIDPGTYIRATDIISVTEYNRGRKLPEGAGLGDPSMMMLFPTTNFKCDYLFIIPAGYPDGNFVNIIVSNAGITDVLLDGASMTGWEPLPGGTHSWIMAPVSAGEHVIDSPLSFQMGAYVHGYKTISTSYNYPAGALFPPAATPTPSPTPTSTDTPIIRSPSPTLTNTVSVPFSNTNSTLFITFLVLTILLISFRNTLGKTSF